MSEEQNTRQDNLHATENDKIVTSVGNAWIICRSKSHLKRIYYFNTLTGQAVWNLSPPEIEKAKLRTNVIEKQSGGQIDGCIEPIEPPCENVHVGATRANMEPLSKNMAVSDTSRGNVLNTPFANQSFSMAPIVAPHCSNTIFCPPLTPINQLGLNVTSQFNPQIWSFPPTHQIYLSSNTAIPSHLQTPVNVAFNNLSNSSVLNTTPQNSSIPLSSRFKIINNLKTLDKVKKKRYIQNNRPRYGQGFSNRTEFQDLRQKLSAKRQWNRSYSYNENEEINDNTDDHLLNNTEELLAPKIELSHSKTSEDSDNGDDTIKEYKEAANPIIHIENLKKFASRDTIKSVWYILTDADVLINHLNFISSIISSDDGCRLLVPFTVMTDLRDATRGITSHLMINSRRAIRYFTEQQKNGRAEIDEDTTETNSNRNSQILRTGLKMVDGNYFVVIISDDEELQRRKSFINIPIFTVEYINNLLTNNAFHSLEKPFENILQSPNKVRHQNSAAIMTENFSKERPNEAQPLNSISTITSYPSIPSTEEEINESQPHNSVVISTEPSIRERPNVGLVHNSVAVLTDRSNEERLNEKAPQNSVSITTEHPTKESQTDTLKIFSKKLTVDTGVQTDDNSLQSNVKENYKDFGHTVHMDKIIQVSKTTEPDLIGEIEDGDKSLNKDVKVKSNFKRRDIYLKRSLHNKISSNVKVSKIVENRDQKHFKWRRRKCTSQSTNIERSEPNSKSTSQTGTSDDSGYKNSALNSNKIISTQTSSESFNDTLESDAGSSVNKVQNSKEKIVIEETSTSGVISNSASNVDSESIYSMCKKKSMNITENDDTGLSFEAIDRNVEEYFRRRSDEWVSRFVQIMEEALTQVLIQGPSISNAMPPPWTIREATECIVKKFENDSNVLDAAICFNGILNKISDDKGKINTDLRPSEYMNMYNYGAHMIDMLQNVMKNNEDLQMAAESLTELLNEIMNPNLDLHDSTLSHLDGVHDASANVSYTQEQGIEQSEANHKDNALSITVSEPSNEESTRRKYNLRSNVQKCNIIANKEQSEVAQRAVESTFFSSLCLQKTDVDKTDAINQNFVVPKVASKQKSNIMLAHNDPIKVTISNPMAKNVAESHTKRKVQRSNVLSDFNLLNTSCNVKDDNNSKNQSKITKKVTDANCNDGICFQDTISTSEIEKNDCNIANQIVSEPKIIRNFTTCLEIEEKLKSKFRQPLDLDQLDYDEDDDCQDTEKQYGNHSHFENTAEYRETYNNVKKIDVNVLIGNILNEIKDTFFQTQQFCQKSYKALEQWRTLSIDKRCELKEKALRMHSHINCMCDVLNSILNRDSKSEVVIKNFLRESGANNLSDEVFNTYRDIITKSVVQANALSDTVKIFLDAIERI